MTGGWRVGRGLAIALLVTSCSSAPLPGSTSEPRPTGEGAAEIAEPTAEDILAGVVTHPFRDTEIGLTLARYDVEDGQLVRPRRSVVVPDQLEPIRDDVALHREAWSFWWAMAPPPWRDDVVQLLIATDGEDGILASVTPVGSTPDDWILHIDPAELDDQAELEETLVHELAHILSLREGQVLRYDSSPFGYVSLDAARRACTPRIGVEDGCLTDDSYLGRFIDRFWARDRLDRADDIAASDDPSAAATRFFEEFPTEFANDYAASHPTEDFAEAWVTFVLYEYEGNAELWARKAAFFEDIPELVEARDHIWHLLDLAP